MNLKIVLAVSLLTLSTSAFAAVGDGFKAQVQVFKTRADALEVDCNNLTAAKVICVEAASEAVGDQIAELAMGMIAEAYAGLSPNLSLAAKTKARVQILEGLMARTDVCDNLGKYLGVCSARLSEVIKRDLKANLNSVIGR